MKQKSLYNFINLMTLDKGDRSSTDDSSGGINFGNIISGITGGGGSGDGGSGSNIPIGQIIGGIGGLIGGGGNRGTFGGGGGETFSQIINTIEYDIFQGGNIDPSNMSGGISDIIGNLIGQAAHKFLGVDPATGKVNSYL